MAGSVQFQHQSLLGDHEQRAGRRAQAIQVHAARVVDTVLPGGPGLATILGTQQQIEGTGDESRALIGEPHIQQRLVGALGGEQFGILFQALRLGVIRVGRVAVLLEQDRGDLLAI
ncbi:hypothetical protein D3C71_1863010 [compost metagenome]